MLDFRPKLPGFSETLISAVCIDEQDAAVEGAYTTPRMLNRMAVDKRAGASVRISGVVAP